MTDPRDLPVVKPRRQLEPAEIPIWDAIEKEVRAEFEDAYEVRYAEMDEQAIQLRDRAARALAAVIIAGIAVGLPVLALVAGASWRLMLWAAGYRPLF